MTVVEKRTGPPTMALLGAGASVNAGLPTSMGLTMEMARFISGNKRNLDAPLRFALNMIEAHRAARRQEAGVDIERLFTVVEMLSELDENPLGPFIQGNPNLESVAQPHGISQTFGELRREMLLALPRLLSLPESASVDYLEPLLRRVETTAGSVATLHSKLTVETAAQKAGLRFSTGHVNDWGKGERMAFSRPGSTPLLKLHGSINWVQRDPIRGESVGVFEECQVDEKHVPAIVFGEGNKLRADGPFLEILDGFGRSLNRTQCLITVGYSFRDPHINSQLIRWFRKRGNCRLVVIDPSIEQSTTAPAAWTQFRTRLRNDQFRPDRIMIMQRNADEGIVEALQQLPLS